MKSNVLVTGAAGYIGGSIVADFLASNSPLLREQEIFAAVRSQEQDQALSKLGINVIQLDLTDEKAIIESVLRHESAKLFILRSQAFELTDWFVLSIIINTASSIKPSVALHLVTALGRQRELSGNETYIIHTSGLSGFYERTGWPASVNKDIGPVFETEKQLADSFPIRETDVRVIEQAKAEGVTSFIVIPSLVYGKGTGEWNQLSVVLPPVVQASISGKKVHKFAEDAKVSGVHISDMIALYSQIVQKILQKEAIPHGEDGYYFALAHDLHMWEIADHLAVALKARGLLTDSKVEIWPNDEAVAEAMGVPEKFVQIFWNAGENMTAEKPYKIGWKPVWSKERSLQNIDDEIQAVVELGKAKSSLMDSLHAAARG